MKSIPKLLLNVLLVVAICFVASRLIEYCLGLILGEGFLAETPLLLTAAVRTLITFTVIVGWNKYIKNRREPAS